MNSQDLLSYIKQARKSGMTHDQIRRALLDVGWREEDINETLQLSFKDEFLHKSLILKLLPILIIVGLIVGYFAFAYYLTIWPFESEISVSTSSKQVEKITRAGPVTDDSMSDWKVYRNEEYGFEFKYPESWKLELDNSTPILNSQSLKISKDPSNNITILINAGATRIASVGDNTKIVEEKVIKLGEADAIYYKL